MTLPSDDEVDSARALREAAETEPDTVDVTDVVDRLVLGDGEERRFAFEAFEVLFRDRPSAVDTTTSRLERHLAADDAETRSRGALAAGALAERHAEAIVDLVPELRSIGSDPAEPGREPAVLALSRLALEQPADAVPAIDTLVKICHAPVVGPDDSSGQIGVPDKPASGGAALKQERERRDEARIHAIAGLTRIAASDAEAMHEVVPDVADLLEDENHLVRAAACEVLEAVAEEFPEDVAPFASELATRVASDTNHPVPWRAADALLVVGETQPERVGDAVAPFVDDLSRFLDSRDDERRAVGTTLLKYVARARPKELEPMVPAAQELLKDDASSVRRNAALALGFTNVDEDRTSLAELVVDDPDADVRDAARRSLERISEYENDDS